MQLGPDKFKFGSVAFSSWRVPTPCLLLTSQSLFFYAELHRREERKKERTI